jgi:hypothetical protein
MKWVRIGLVWGGAACGLLATGCPNPNVYGTPRTTPKGKISHTIAAETVGYRVDLNEDYEQYEEAESSIDPNVTVPTMPTYILRVGAADRLDFGFRAANAATSLGFDFKWNLVRSPVFDFALDPMLQWAFALDITHLHFPLLFGINASESFSVVLTPGIIYGYSDDLDEIDNDLSRVMGTDGFSARFGAGFNIRISPRFAIQPELTLIRSLEDHSDSEFDSVLMYVFGVGFNIANLPDFSDVDAPPAAQK